MLNKYIVTNSVTSRRKIEKSETSVQHYDVREQRNKIKLNDAQMLNQVYK